MKHISCIDNLDNLRALVRHELREIGIKVPKQKKTKRGAPKSVQDVNKCGIFGTYLSRQECVLVQECGYVSKFLVDAAKIITEHIESEGIFRKSGAVSRQKEIKQQLENGQGFEGANVHDVTNLVKQFFRELQEPLFTSSFHDTFVRCYNIEDKEQSTRALLLSCLLLPGEHISTLRFTMKLLARIAGKSEQNKMDSNNLAVVLAPNIMHVNSKSETMKSCEEKLLQVQTSVVEVLINNADDVGMVDDGLVERTAYMSEVFSTDDELDASEDNLEDSKDTRQKDKKRKRSGSFQGFVSSIANSITKWRRSTDGKTNTSGMSQASNTSRASVSKSSNQPEDSSTVSNPVYQFSATDATPVVRRKKPHPGTESKAFSASKKKAILNNLPQHSALASTPYTPMSTVKKKDTSNLRRGIPHDTPSIPPRPYQTPRQSMKTPRKKLALFSPASTTKKKRYSSSSQLMAANKKTAKSKGIFRRLSGSKGDQTFPVSTSKSNSQQQIGQRLANSPTYTTACTIPSREPTCGTQTIKPSARGSPVHPVGKSASFTAASICEQSVISNGDEETQSLNEGFIMTADDRDVDISRIMSEPVIAGSIDTGEYVTLGDVQVHESLSDSSVFAQNRFDTPSGCNRSLSADSVLENSARNTSLKRGRPNSIRVGLLHGDQKEVHKLRRSFGLDKSEIGYPIPVSVADVSDCDHYVQLENSFDGVLNDKTGLNDVSDKNNDDGTCATSGEDNGGSPGSVSRCNSAVNSATNLNSVDMSHKDTDSTAGYECNDESEAGFSTISGGTAVFVPKMSVCGSEIKVDDNSDTNKDTAEQENEHKTLAQQKQESKDSLLSDTSSYLSPTLPFKEREMTRSISGDSGKGSLCEEQMDDSPSTPQSSVADQTQDTVFTENMDVDKSEKPRIEEGPILTSGLQNKKSVSTQDLVRDSEITPVKVARSKSLLDSSLSQRKPNLQISAETHKLLARAGYIKEQNPEQKVEDFIVPGTLAFPFIKQAETINPRRESIIALQKNNAGFVRSNIRQFDRISESGEERHTSPFRFPNSTTRKRGMSPLRLPTTLGKGKDAELLKHTLNTSIDKLAVGTARVPISTQMIKLSDPEKLNESADAIAKNCGVKRKPSIYYANKDGISPPVNKFRNLMNGSSTVSPDISTSQNETLISMDESTNISVMDENVFESKECQKATFLEGQSSDLNMSLQETINLVCTPLSEKFKQTCEKDRIGQSDKENSETSKAKMPEIKPSFLTTPLKIDSSTLRTATNKTPLEVLKATRSPRSPVKPLKRLGSSPHSPRCRNVRSPKLIKNRRSLLSAIPSQNEELNNL